MRRALLAWEGGAGRGHISTLKAVAAEAGDLFRFDAALCRMEHASEIASLCDAVFPGAALVDLRDERLARGNLPDATWGQFLGFVGFRDKAFLRRQVSWWQEVLRVRRIDLVIADFAPCALLAARSMGIPCINIGVGYMVFPPGLNEFPVYTPAYTKLTYDEAEMVAIINDALDGLSVPQLSVLPDVYACDDQLACTLPQLDPFFELRKRPLLPPITGVSSTIAAGGDRVFVYFSTTEFDDPALVDALCDLGLPVTAFLPGVDGGIAGRLSAGGVDIIKEPARANQIAATTALLVNAGQHGTLCLGIAAGIPQVTLPQHLEQLYHAERAQELGTARVIGMGDDRPARLRAAIREAYHDRHMADAARTLARQVRPHFEVSSRKLIRRSINSVTL